ncbi:hypothetical protein [Streptomyces sp. NPDC058989]
MNSRDRIPYYRWQRHFPRLIQDRRAGLMMAGAALIALSFSVIGGLA